MKIKFNPNMEYQLKAINSTIGIFNGQAKTDGTFVEVGGGNDGILDFRSTLIRNVLTIGKEEILENLRYIQKGNGLEKSKKLESMDFSIEMETGTGKTYTYLRSIFELNKRYGFKKFIIVVPSVAIREGVLKTIEMTKEHFKEHFENVPFNYFVYDGGKLSNVRGYAVSNEISIMIINIDSFNKDSNIIRRYDDRIQGVPLEFIQTTNPILILDEPQNMESEKAKEALSSLSPLFTLRYSATHRNVYNLIYKFGAVEAYNQGMVKQIEVLSVYADKDYSGVYLRLVGFKATSTKISAKIEMYVKSTNGEKIEKKEKLVDKNSDLFVLSGGLGSYEGFIVDMIDSANKYISFTNSVRIELNQTMGGYPDEIKRAQIRETIKEHFEKERRLAPKGIKVLSLFFIDRVASYAEDDGFIRKAFIEEFEALQRDPVFESMTKGLDIDSIHGGYFAKGSKGEAKDTSGNTKADDEAYNLIMRDKERLLSLDEPLRFIFSHSALREGWDNPNVFQICTLNETHSVIKKRQEIGRGLRICVDKNGERNYDREINRLTIIANERYEAYAKNLQKEYEEEGIIGAPPVKNKRKKITVTLRKGYKLDENFRELWEKIKHKTKYRVNFDTEGLIARCIEEINKHTILASSGRIGVDKVKVILTDEGIETKLAKISTPIGIENTCKYVPDIITHLQKETHLTRTTIVRILTGINGLEDVFKNPEEFLINITTIIKYVKNKILIEKIQYEKIDDYYEMSLFQESFESFEDNLIKVENEKKGIYTHIEFDSDIERGFVEKLNAREDVKLFVKLPFWFKVDTPIGTYNPDWAIVKQNGDKVYLIRETKGTTMEGGLRGDEKDKIHCGGAHFKKLGVDYNVDDGGAKSF
jgi:type III restriction enzyme